MIHIFFVAGMFGSTIEHVLRSFTKEYKPTNAKILPDGSMHSYKKEWHPCDILAMQKFETLQSDSITTPTYPFKDAHLPEILNVCNELLPNSKSILLYADSLRSAEINLLFQYHKVAVHEGKLGLARFCGKNTHNIVKWNLNYKSWTDMQQWELREWFSLFYVSWVHEWSESYNQVPENFLKISNTEMLLDTTNTLLKIIDFCDLTYNPSADLNNFVTEWQQKQSYIVEEFNLLDRIVENTLNKVEYKWKDLNIIAESIIQQRLRTSGYEICCDGLNAFPTNSLSLYNLLEKC